MPDQLEGKLTPCLLAPGKGGGAGDGWVAAGLACAISRHMLFACATSQMHNHSIGRRL